MSNKKRQSKSFTLEKRNNLYYKSQQLKNIKKQQLYDQQSAEVKLPILKIKKVLGKIGAVAKTNKGFVPNQADHKQFQRKKIAQLKQQYSSRKGKKEQFDFELDDIVLDCWKYGQSYGRKTIWKMYRQNFDELVYDTYKAVHLKKI